MCSVRFVPDQRPDDLVAKLKAHVETQFSKLKSGNNVSVKVKSVGDWWEADPQSKLFRLAENALFKVRHLRSSAHYNFVQNEQFCNKFLHMTDLTKLLTLLSSLLPGTIAHWKYVRTLQIGDRTQVVVIAVVGQSYISENVEILDR